MTSDRFDGPYANGAGPLASAHAMAVVCWWMAALSAVGAPAAIVLARTR